MLNFNFKLISHSPAPKFYGAPTVGSFRLHDVWPESLDVVFKMWIYLWIISRKKFQVDKFTPSEIRILGLFLRFTSKKIFFGHFRRNFHIFGNRNGESCEFPIVFIYNFLFWDVRNTVFFFGRWYLPAFRIIWAQIIAIRIYTKIKVPGVSK